MTDDNTEAPLPLPVLVHSLRESLTASRMLAVEAERNLHQRLVLYNRIELALGGLARHFSGIEPLQQRAFPALNGTEDE